MHSLLLVDALFFPGRTSLSTRKSATATAYIHLISTVHVYMRRPQEPETEDGSRLSPFCSASLYSTLLHIFLDDAVANNIKEE